MIEHVYRRAALASGAVAVLVATDDKRIQDAVLNFGGKVQLTEPHHRNGMERLAEVADRYHKLGGVSSKVTSRFLTPLQSKLH